MERRHWRDWGSPWREDREREEHRHHNRHGLLSRVFGYDRDDAPPDYDRHGPHERDRRADDDARWRHEQWRSERWRGQDAEPGRYDRRDRPEWVPERTFERSYSDDRWPEDRWHDDPWYRRQLDRMSNEEERERQYRMGTQGRFEEQRPMRGRYAPEGRYERADSDYQRRDERGDWRRYADRDVYVSRAGRWSTNADEGESQDSRWRGNGGSTGYDRPDRRGWRYEDGD